ncbi:MAG: autotransporter-associated beta strand repeat-containing protein [Verrucomicrobiia bacterium]
MTVNGNGAVSFAGANNSFNRLYVNSGVVTFSGTNAVISSSPLTIRGGTVTLLATSTNWFSGGHTYINAGTLDINGPVTFGIIGGASSTTNSLVIGSATDDRGVVSVTTNVIVSGQTLIGNGSGSAGALYQGDGIYSNVSSVYIGSAAGGYGYMSLTNGRFSSAGQTRVGNAGVGVMEVLGGEALISGGVIMDRSAGGVGVLNVLGGRFAVTGSGALTFGYGDQATTYGLINVGNGGILDLATGSTTKILNLNVSTNGPGGGTGIVNVLSGGTLVVNKLGASALGTTLLNFNGGTLKASPGTTVGATFMTNGLAGAYIYSGGATINTDTNIIFIAQSLRAPVGYGLTNIALGYSGEGYIGAPAVIISGGSGSGATAIAQWDPVTGTITNILITSAGSGYLSNDVLSIALVGGGFTRPADVGTFSFGTNSTSGGLTKAGSGELHLTGTNTYKGVTVLLEGTLVIYSPDNIPVGNTIEFAGGAFSPLGTASLDDYLLSGDFAFDVPLGSVLAVNNSLTGAGSTLTKLGEGLLIVTGNNDYGSGTFISNGLIRFNSPASLPTTSMITMEAGSMVSLVTNSVNAGLVPYIGAQDFGAIGLLPTNATENSEDINFNNAGPGARVFTNLSFGAGSNLLYTGTYTPYQRDGTNFWRLAAFYGVTLTFSNTMTNYTEASILEVNKGGNGLCGTVALIGTNTYSGGTFIGGGTLSILGDFSLGAALGSPATNFTFLGNATLQFVTSMNLDANRAFSMAGGTGTFDTLANTVVIPGTIGGDGSMRKVGIGTLVLNSNTDTVQFLTVNAGTLWLSNTLFTATGVFANGSITVGDSATDNNATMIVDTNSVVRMTAGANNPFTVGNYGSGNTLIVTNGGAVYAGATNYPGFWMGNQAASSSNLTMVIGTNSLMASTGRVLVGDDGSFNTMMILGGGTVSNANYVEVGRTGTASNNLLVVSDGGSLLTNSGSGFIIGESGTGNMAIFTNGARGATTSALMIGYGVGAHNNGVTIIGTGTVVNVVGEVQIAGGSTIRNGGPTNNTLMILDGGTLINANWITVGRFSNASDNLLLVSGEGSLLTNTANGIIVGNYGRNNTAIITNGARVVTAGRVALGYNSIGSNNSLYVGGVGTLLSAASHIQVGTNGSYNLMVVGNGGSVTCATVFAVGASSSASNNTAIITDTGTVVSIAGELRVGELGSGNTAMILTGATVNLSSWVQVGRGAGALDNFLLVSGEGAWLNNTASANGIIVGNSGASGVAIFTNSARVDAPRLAIGYTAAGTNNSVFVGGAGTLLKIGSGGIQVGTNGWLSTMWVGSGATVTNAGVLQIGSAGSTSNNTLTVSGANTRFDSAGEIWLGNTDTHHNVMQILNGAVVTNSSFFLIGRRVGADSNTLIVNNASLFNGRVIGVGGSGAGNVAIFTNGAQVVTPQFDISRSTDSSNNSAYISSAGTSVQVGGDVRIGAPFDSSFNLLDVGGNSILQAGSNVFVGGTTSNIGVGNQFVLSGGATGIIGGDLVISTNSMLRNLSSGTVVLAGHFDNLSTNFTQNDFSGRFIFNGGGARIQLIEISSAYTTDMVVTNFMAGRFQVGDPVTGSNAYVRLVDERANSAGIGSEILAVSNLVVATSGSTLDLTNHTVFALYAGNTGMIQQAVADGVGRLDIVNTFTNQGNLYAIGGGILQFSNAFVNGPNGTIGLIAGTFTNFVTSGALTNRGTIGGGGLISVEIGNEATGRIAATNAGGGGILTLGAGFTNSGTGPVNAGLLAALGAGAELRINQSFTNAGQIWMNDETAALRLIDSSSNLVNAAGAKIEGLGAVHAFVENNGVVSNEMGGTLTFSLAAVNNNGGVMGAYNAGSVLNFDSVVTNQVGGVLRAANGGRLLFNAGLTNHGTLSIGASVNPSTAIITGTLLMGSTGIITMAHTNDTLIVRGNFVNGSTDTNNFNMRYGTMVFGSTTATITNTFEEASTNKGVTFGGFNQNMALGTLEITNHIEFVNNINNGGGLGTNECLYVDVLHLFNGATLKLSQLTIYVGVEFIYEDGNGTKTLTGAAGEAITEFNKDSYGLANVFLDNGGQIVFVPEPSTGALMGLGLAALAGWRRRRRITQR